jgi:hypothetical protein
VVGVIVAVVGICGLVFLLRRRRTATTGSPASEDGELWTFAVW